MTTTDSNTAVTAGAIGVVAIGRNEGERLRQCLASVLDKGRCVVYVDSGSTDSSVAMARSMGAEVVELDMSIPFTMARGRNAGWRWLAQNKPGVQLIQFVDGDCELHPEWIARAVAVFATLPDAAAVAGRRRERFPEASFYNRLCDIEWSDGRIGVVAACLGDVMMRVEALKATDGFAEGMIAGEEPELCFRLRERGFKIIRVDAEMTLHDAAMTRFGQWWRRAIRGGHAYAEGMAMHGRTSERFWVRECLRGWAWAVAWPLLLAALLWPTGGWSAAGLLIYPVQIVRIARRQRRRGSSPRDAFGYGVACVLANWPQVWGQVVYWANRLRGRATGLIEYKGPAAAAPAVPRGKGAAT